MYWFGNVCSVIGILSFVILSRIFYKYHDMYPWFDGLQPWITGYYLLPLGGYLLLVRWMFINNILSYEFSWVDSGSIIFLFIVLFGLAIGIQYYLRRVMVLAGQIKSKEKESADPE